MGPLMAGFLYDETGDYTIAFKWFFGTMAIVALALIFARPLGMPPSESASSGLKR
jgi:cyanate permease